MHWPIFIRCAGPDAAAARRPGMRRRLAARLALLALAGVMLFVALYGERWFLQQSAAIPDEWIVATCVLGAADADGRPMNACTRGSE